MKKRLWRIILAALIYIAAICTNIDWLKFLLFFSSYILIGYDVIFAAAKNIIKGQVFDENFLMGIATIGAFLIGEYAEGVAVMLFYQVGELFQDHAVDKSRKSIANLMDIRPDYANVKRKDEIIKVDPDEVEIGEIIIVKPGEKVPLDGRVIDGSSSLDTTALTGESLPREIEIGDDLLSGCININGVLTAEVTKEFDDSTVNKILDLVENASSRKSKSEQFITKFARYYTPIVVIIAAFLALIPPLLIQGASFTDWIYRALSFLVISCPCALVLSIPLSFFGGIGGAAKKGILVKGGNYLESLAQAKIVVFDKTGTLTKGVFNVQKIYSQGLKEEELLELTAYAESYSNHPISLSLKKAYGQEIDNNRIENVEELSGYGVKAVVDKKLVLVGNGRLMDKMNISYTESKEIGTIIHIAVDEQYAGYIVIADELKEDSAQAIRGLKDIKINQTIMLTGDRNEVAKDVSKKLGIDKVYAELLPGDKVEKIEELLKGTSANGKLVFVGDGINDAPVLARADIGIAMGGLGSDAAIEAADIVIMDDKPSKIHTAIKISQKTLKIAYQNMIFAIGIKVFVLILSALGYASMWAAIFADVGVTILAVLNAFRALNVKDIR